MLATRVDIVYTVIKLSRYAINPSEIHIIAIKRILRYLKATINYKITYIISNILSNYLISYLDANYIKNINITKLTSGYIFFIANSPIFLKSKL